MPEERTGPLSGARVLIVEDEYYLADDLSRHLSQAGAEVVGPVGSLAEAETAVAEGQFDFAVLDMNLRGDFSHAVAERLGDARIPFIVATGYGQESLPGSLKNVPRLEKPYTPHQVLELLAGMREGSETPS